MSPGFLAFLLYLAHGSPSSFFSRVASHILEEICPMKQSEMTSSTIIGAPAFASYFPAIDSFLFSSLDIQPQIIHV